MYDKCCVPSCRSKRNETRLHKFPSNNRIENKKIWLHNINCDKLRAKGNLISNMYVCCKHFERRFVKQSGRLTIDAYPTLFSEVEISTGISNTKPALSDPLPGMDHLYSRQQHYDHTYCAPVDHTTASKDIILEICRGPVGESKIIISLTDPKPNTSHNEQEICSATASESRIIIPTTSKHISNHTEQEICNGSTGESRIIIPTTSNQISSHSEQETCSGPAGESWINVPTTSKHITSHIEQEICSGPTGESRINIPTISKHHSSHTEQVISSGPTGDSRINIPTTSKRHSSHTEQDGETQQRYSKKKLIRDVSSLTPECRLLYNEYKKVRRQRDAQIRAKKAVNFSKEKTFELLTKNMNPLAQKLLWMQVKLSTKSITGRRFTDDEKLIGLEVYKQSPKSYKLLQQLFILPSKTTLNKMISSSNIEPNQSINGQGTGQESE